MGDEEAKKDDNDAEMAGQEVAEEEGEDLKLMAEEYKVWKKNSPFLYDIVMSHALYWPSLTVQWFPECTKDEGGETTSHKLLLGTHTSGGEPNQIMIADVKLPSMDAELVARNYDEKNPDVSGFGCRLDKIDVKVQVPHDGEVNRARIMPQNSNIIATKSPNSNVYVYDWTKYIPSSSGGPAKPPTKPQQTCTGHDAEGYGLVWSPHEQGKLLSGSDDGKLCLWDTHRAGAVVEPFQCREGHNGMVIEDVDWHRFHANTYGSVGDDGGISLWDLREGGNTSKETIPAHSGDANGLSFCPLDEFLMASGGSDKVVKLWDMRNTKHPLHALESPTDVVVQVSFSPFAKEVLACSCKDRKIYMWNLSKVGAEQDPEEAEDGPPELTFVHSGHTARVSEFNWNPCDDEEWTVASISEDNILQVWQPAMAIVFDDDILEEVKEICGMDDDDLEAVEEGEEEEDEEEDGADKGGAAKKARADDGGEA